MSSAEAGEGTRLGAETHRIYHIETLYELILMAACITGVRRGYKWRTGPLGQEKRAVQQEQPDCNSGRTEEGGIASS